MFSLSPGSRLVVLCALALNVSSSVAVAAQTSRYEIRKLTRAYTGGSTSEAANWGTMKEARKKLLKYLGDKDLEPAPQTRNALNQLVLEAASGGDKEVLKAAMRSAKRLIQGQENVIEFLRSQYEASNFQVVMAARKALIKQIQDPELPRTRPVTTALEKVLKAAQGGQDRELIDLVEDRLS